jgi:hypothetical protein
LKSETFFLFAQASVLHSPGMRATSFLVFASFLLSAIASTAQTPPSAEEVLGKAKAQASKEQKNIFVVFDASW